MKLWYPFRNTILLEKLGAQIDDLTAALATATSDTQKLIADVAAEVAALKASLGTTPPDLTAAIASANNIDALVKAADPGAQSAPTP